MLTRAHRHLGAGLIATLALSVCPAHAMTAGMGAGLAVPTTEIIEDRTPEMWSARWWMWAASFRGEESPVTDREGTRCSSGQEGETFFLAGAYGSDPVQRTCTVPRGKYLFFPLLTYIVLPDGGSRDCDQLKSEARSMVRNPTLLFAQVDGRAIPALESRRAAPAKCFNVNARTHGPNVSSASDGYWLMLRPLPPGRHTLHFGGQVTSLSQDITYSLIVE